MRTVQLVVVVVVGISTLLGLGERYELKKMLLYHFVFGKQLYKADLSWNGAITMSSDDDSVTLYDVDDVPHSPERVRKYNQELSNNTRIRHRNVQWGCH